MVIIQNVYREITPGDKKFKRFTAGIIFHFLGRGLMSASEYDPIVKGEAAVWNDGLTIMMLVDSKGPAMAVRKENGKLIYKGLKKVDNPDIAIHFKNIEAALLVLTGRLSVAGAYAEHRFYATGDLSVIMSVVRALYVVEAHLFPGFILKHLFYRIPKKGTSSLRIYLNVLLGL